MASLKEGEAISVWVPITSLYLFLAFTALTAKLKSSIVACDLLP